MKNKKIAILMALVMLFSTALVMVPDAQNTAKAVDNAATLTFLKDLSVVQIGNQVTVTGNINSNVDVAVFMAAVTYDNALLQYVSATGIGLDSGELTIVPEAGSITVLYMDNDGGYTGIPSGGAGFFKITFNAIGAGTVSVDAIIDSVGDVNIVDIPTTVVPLVFDVVLEPTPVPSPTPIPDTATLSFSKDLSVVQTGDQVIVAGNINSTAVIATLMFDLTFDETKLQYVSAVGVGLAPGELDVQTNIGKVTFLYLDTEGGYSGIPTGGSDFFQVTFNAIGAGSVLIDAVEVVVGDINIVEIVTTVEPLAFDIASGPTPVPTATPVPTPTPTPTPIPTPTPAITPMPGGAILNFSKELSSVAVGDQIVVTGNINSTKEVGVFMGTVIYDANKLEYVSSTSIGLSAGEMDIVADVGTATLLYLDADGGYTGIPVGGADFFQITFNVIAEGATTIDMIDTSVGDINADNIPLMIQPLAFNILSTPQITPTPQPTATPVPTPTPEPTPNYIATFDFTKAGLGATVGDQVVITGSVNSNEDVAVLFMVVTYDANKLRFISGTGVGLMPGEIDIYQTENGINLLYVDNDGGSTGIPAGGADVFELTFEALQMGSVTIDAVDTMLGAGDMFEIQTTIVPLAFDIIKAPIVTGVEEGGIYNTNKTITFDEGTATLNGAPFANGGTVTAEGAHTLVVTNAYGISTIVHFTIDKTPPQVLGVTNGGAYKTDRIILFNEGVALLNGQPMGNGTAVSNEGSYTLVVTDIAGNVTTVNFVIDKTAPLVSGVEEGVYYKTNRTIAFNEGTATLNGVPFTNGSVVSVEGTYTLVVTDAAGNKTTVHFTMDKTPPQVSGVLNGATYNFEKTITFNEGTATLNAQPFAGGTTVSGFGAYVLVVTDAAGNQTTVSFIIQAIDIAWDVNGAIVTGVNPGTTVNAFALGFSVAPTTIITIKNASGTVISGTMKVGTGTVVDLANDQGQVMQTYTLVIYGDVNGDGTINAIDLLAMRKALLGQISIAGVYAIAADVSKAIPGFNAIDILMMRKYLLGQIEIIQ